MVDQGYPDLKNLNSSEVQMLSSARDNGILNEYQSTQVQQAKSQSLIQDQPWFPSAHGSGTNREDRIEQLSNGNIQIQVDGSGQDLSLQESGYFIHADFSEIVDAVLKRTADDYTDKKLDQDAVGDDTLYATKGAVPTKDTDVLDKTKKTVYGDSARGYILATPNLRVNTNVDTDPTKVKYVQANGDEYHMVVPYNMNGLCFSRKKIILGTNSAEVDDASWGLVKVNELLKRSGMINTGKTGAAIMNTISPWFGTEMDAASQNFYTTDSPESDEGSDPSYIYDTPINNFITKDGRLFRHLNMVQKTLTEYIPLKYELSSIDADNLPARFPLIMEFQPATYGEVIKFVTSFAPISGENNYSDDANINTWGDRVKILPVRADLIQDIASTDMSIWNTPEMIALLKKPIKMSITTRFRSRNPQYSTLSAQNQQLTSGQNESYTYRPRYVTINATHPIQGAGTQYFGPHGTIGQGGAASFYSDYSILFPQISGQDITKGPWNFNTFDDLRTLYKNSDQTTNLPIRKHTNVPYLLEPYATEPWHHIEQIELRVNSQPGGGGPASNRVDSKQYFNPTGSKDPSAQGWYLQNQIDWLNLLTHSSIPGVRVDGQLNKATSDAVVKGLMSMLGAFNIFSLQVDGTYTTQNGQPASAMRSGIGAVWMFRTRSSTTPIQWNIINFSTSSITWTDSGAVLVSNGNETL